MKSRLFIKFLLLMLTTSLSVVILMVITMQFFVYRNFSDYVVQQELDSLDDLVKGLLIEYQKDNSWENFRNDPRRWHEMVDMYSPGREPRQPWQSALDSQDRSSGEGGQAIQDAMAKREDAVRGDFRRNRENRNQIRPFPAPRRVPEMSPLARRLSLFDRQKQVVLGNPVISDQALRAIDLDNHAVGWLGLRKDRQMMSPTDISFLKRQSVAFYMIGAIVLLMAVMISVIFSRHLTSPVRKIAEGTRAIRNRRFDTRITVVSNDELGQLAEDFNVMAQTLQSYENIRRQWLSDIAHELRTPLAVLRGEIEALQDGIREINSYTMDSLHSEVMALSKIVNDLSLIAKTESGIIEMKRMPVNLIQVAEAVIQRFKARFDDCQMNIRTDFQKPDSTVIVGDAAKLTQVFVNIFENVIRYATSPGTLTVWSIEAKDYIRIIVEDTGPGVPKESLNKLFDRLYRTDTARARETGGSGLGLSICKSIIEAHQGRIYAENAETGGVRIVMELPRLRK